MKTILITGGAGFIGSSLIRHIIANTDQYPTPAIRPKNTTLSKEKITNHFKLQIPSWQQSLKECLNEVM